MDGSERSPGPVDLDSSGMVLLPPNYFTVPTPRASSHDPLWTRSALQEEVERLRSELTEVRQQHRTESPRTTDAAPAVGSGNSAVLNEVLAQQATELTRLRTEADRVKAEHIRETASLQAMIENYQRQAVENEETSQNRLRDLMDDYERRLNEKELEISGLSKQHEAEELSIQVQAQKQEEIFRQRLEEKNNAFVKMANSHEALKERLSITENELESVRERLKNMMVCESWAVDRIETMRQLEELEDRFRSSESANELKQHRIDTLQKILSLQESELAKHGPSENQQAVVGLLGRWREKVFTLMVQAESADIAHTKEVQRHLSTISDLKQTLDRTQCAAATCDLKLQACHAEVADEKEKAMQLAIQLNVARQAHQDAAAQRDDWKNSLSALSRTVESMVRSFAAQERDLASRTLSAMNTMERRLAATADRLPVLKAHVKRLQAKEAVNQLRKEHESRMNDLRGELDLVRTDRDRLAKHMEKDAEESGIREQHLRQEYETEVSFLARKCESLQLEIDLKSRRLEAVEHDLGDSQVLRTTLEDDNQQLREKLSTTEGKLDEAVLNATAQLYAEHTQQMAELQSTLDEVRREHTTCVIALRQAERDLERTRDQRSADIAAVQDQCEARVADLQRAMSNLEAERNLLKATVRQEGLLRSVPGPAPGSAPPQDSWRQPPAALEDRDDIQRKAAAAAAAAATAEFSPHLANLIEEVRSLVRSVEASEEVDASDEED